MHEAVDARPNASRVEKRRPFVPPASLSTSASDDETSSLCTTDDDLQEVKEVKEVKVWNTFKSAMLCCKSCISDVEEI